MQKLKKNEARPKFTGSYKKKRVFDLLLLGVLRVGLRQRTFCCTLFKDSIFALLDWLSLLLLMDKDIMIFPKIVILEVFVVWRMCFLNVKANMNSTLVTRYSYNIWRFALLSIYKLSLHLLRLFKKNSASCSAALANLPPTSFRPF